MICPNKNLPEWQALEKTNPELALYYWNIHNGNPPNYLTDSKVLQELFDSNPELANAVYEALGFKQNNLEASNRLKKAEQDLKEIYEIGLAVTIEEVEKAEGKKIIVLDTNDFKNKNQKSVSFDRIFIPEQYRKQGLGLSLYIIRGEELLKEGKYLVNYDQLSDEALGIWKRLIDLGLATQAGEYGTYQYIGLQSQITPEQKQQAQQQYSQYLSTIFPDSKVKDIVYHDTDAKFDEFKSRRGIYFNVTKEAGFTNALYKIAAIINLKNPAIEDMDSYGGMNTNEVFPKNDGVIGTDSTKTIKGEYIVSKPSQIHILGNKQDVEGFKQFLTKDSSNPLDVAFEDCNG